MLKPDGAHIHHRLLKKGLSQKQAVLLLYTITSVLCIAAVVISSADVWKFILLILIVVSFVTLGVLGKKRLKKGKENIDDLEDIE